MCPFYAILLCVAFSLPLAVHAGSSTDKRAGDEFRQAASEYSQLAQQSRLRRNSSSGDDTAKYQRLTLIFDEMARIKRRAGELADQGQWSAISWDRYEKLSHERNQIQSSLSHRDKASAGQGLLVAAKQYEIEAVAAQQEAKKHTGSKHDLYKQLASLYNEMAYIKRTAAEGSPGGQGFDWSRYQELNQRKDDISSLLRLLTKTTQPSNS